MKKATQDLQRAAQAVFENHGLKKTPQRWAIWLELQGNHSHPSADVIYRRMRRRFPHISYDTVNRTLVHFAALGLVHVVEGTSEVKRFDPITREHHHLRCLRCGRIVDFEHHAYNTLPIPAKVTRSFQILRKRVVLEGICEQCRRQ